MRCRNAYNATKLGRSVRLVQSANSRGAGRGGRLRKKSPPHFQQKSSLTLLTKCAIHWPEAINTTYMIVVQYVVGLSLSWLLLLWWLQLQSMPLCFAANFLLGLFYLFCWCCCWLLILASNAANQTVILLSRLVEYAMQHFFFLFSRRASCNSAAISFRVSARELAIKLPFSFTF